MAFEIRRVPVGIHWQDQEYWESRIGLVVVSEDAVALVFALVDFVVDFGVVDCLGRASLGLEGALRGTVEGA